MMRQSPTVVSAVLLVLSPFAGDAWCQAGEAQETVKAVPHLFAESITLDGTFMPAEEEPIQASFESYKGALEVVEAAQQGAVVEGQVIVRFDAKEYTEQLEAARVDLELARVAFEGKRKDAARTLELIGISFMEAERQFRRAEDDFKYYREVDLPRRIEEEELSVQGYRDSITDAQEELAQLEKMYGEDDLTEETEEIVLRRTRRSLARRLRQAEFREERHQRFLEVNMPRDTEDRTVGMQKATLAFERAREKRDADLTKERLEMEKAETEFAKKVEAFGELEADRGQLILRAPGSGTLVGGVFSGGKWSDVKLEGPVQEIGDKVKNSQVLCTFLPEQTPHVQVSIPEKQLMKVTIGLAGLVTPEVEPERELPARVSAVTAYGKGQFPAMLRLGEPAKTLRPGFTCKVKLNLEEPEEGVGIPVEAVVRSGESAHVMKVVGGTEERVAVELGRTDGELIEVVKGLALGNEVVRKPQQAEGNDSKTEKHEK
ncbi:MAG: hypothetical protein V2A76_17755 [Planctomycetota bacterium]